MGAHRKRLNESIASMYKKGVITKYNNGVITSLFEQPTWCYFTLKPFRSKSSMGTEYRKKYENNFAI